jgi:hypothetical protein
LIGCNDPARPAFREKGAIMTDGRFTGRRHGAKELRQAARKTQLKKESEADLDDALDNSFPASDPPSMVQPRTHLGAPQRDHDSAANVRRRGK